MLFCQQIIFQTFDHKFALNMNSDRNSVLYLAEPLQGSENNSYAK